MKLITALLAICYMQTAYAADKYLNTQAGRIVITEKQCVTNEYGADKVAYITGDDKIHNACWYKDKDTVMVWFYQEPEVFAIPYPYYMFQNKE